MIVDAQLPDLATALQPYATCGTFLNFLADPSRTESAYTPPNYQRLRDVKATYDHDNVFQLNNNIPPAE